MTINVTGQHPTVTTVKEYCGGQYIQLDGERKSTLKARKLLPPAANTF